MIFKKLTKFEYLMKSKLEIVNCDLCGSNSYTEYASQKDLIHKTSEYKFKVVRCNNCGLLYTNPRPKKEFINKFYSSKYSFHNKNNLFTKFIKSFLIKLVNKKIFYSFSFLFGEKLNRFFIKFLKPKINDPALQYINNHKNISNFKFLDIGCGSGVTTNFWGTKSSIISLSKTINVVGIEPSIQARGYLKDKNIDSYSSIREIPSDSKYNLIRLNWSLEHVHSPTKYFQFLNKHLYSDGLIIICVPNNDGLLYKINKNALELPIHLYHYDLNIMEKYCKKYKFLITEKISFSYPGMYCFAEEVGLINQKYKFSKMNLKKAFYLMEWHKILDELGNGNDIILLIKKA